ncbi:hypothetical protein A8B75_13880 [Sphingomonadales bacterium EhC05]|jgi:hemolysin activation/secretion protein|nr:hypothetical protein A8B75_13880 [Sphingomonadales bacterium EhC05]
MFFRRRQRRAIPFAQNITSTSFGAALLGLICLLSGPVNAQTPGNIAAPTRDELRPPSRSAPRQERSVEIEGGVERTSCPLAAPQYRDVRIQIDQVEFNNLQAIGQAELRETYAQYLGSSQPVAIICEIRDTAATLLRNRGYLAAIQVPTQRIENGTIKLEVLYAKVTAIRVRGDTGRSEKLIQSYLEKLTNVELFNRFDAERYLLLSRDMPGYDIRMTLTPAGTGPGELIGEVTVSRTPYRVDLNVQNLAASDTGRWGGQIGGEIYGLTGLGDRTYASFYTSAEFREQQILQLGHDFRIGSEGLKIAGQFTYAWTEPDTGAAAGAARIKAETLFASIEASYPILRRQSASVHIATGLEFIDQDIRFIGPLTKDRLRVGYVRLDGQAIDFRGGQAPKWRARGSVEFRQGLDILGASKPCDLICLFTRTPPSRFDGDPTSSVLRFEGEGELALSDDLSFYVRPMAQMAFDRVFSFEEFSGGNYTIGRGYDPGVITGEDGAAIQFELRGARYKLFEKSDIAVQPFVFLDAAWAWDDSRNGANDPHRLVSVGGGVRANLSDRFRLDLTVAVPTRRAGLQPRKGNARFLLSLTTKLLPWR